MVPWKSMKISWKIHKKSYWNEQIQIFYGKSMKILLIFFRLHEKSYWNEKIQIFYGKSMKILLIFFRLHEKSKNGNMDEYMDDLLWVPPLRLGKAPYICKGYPTSRWLVVKPSEHLLLVWFSIRWLGSVTVAAMLSIFPSNALLCIGSQGVVPNHMTCFFSTASIKSLGVQFFIDRRDFKLQIESIGGGADRIEKWSRTRQWCFIQAS